MTFWQTPNFKSLQRAWYQRLKREGFQDAEELVAGELMLKQTAAHPYRGLDHLAIAAKEAYYRLMLQAVQKGEFRSEIDRLILAMWADGHKICVICRALKAMGSSRNRHTVLYTIRKYEMEWGLREYTPRQLNRREPA